MVEAVDEGVGAAGAEVVANLANIIFGRHFCSHRWVVGSPFVTSPLVFGG